MAEQGVVPGYVSERKDVLYRLLASTLDAYRNCVKAENKEWENRHRLVIEQLAADFLPRGSGFDAGTTVDLEASKDERIVLLTDYHHMDEHGLYDGWTSHQIVVRPSLVHTFQLFITGPNRNDTKEYMYDVFRDALLEEVKWDEASERWVRA